MVRIVEDMPSTNSGEKLSGWKAIDYLDGIESANKKYDENEPDRTKISELEEQVNIAEKKNSELMIDFEIDSKHLADTARLVYDEREKADRLQEELELSRQTENVDSLTEINNNNYLDKWLKNPNNFDVTKSDKKLGIVFIDMDNLKKGVNDKYGHEAGDIALKGIASFLKSNFRSGDICIRKGGDEYVVLCLPRDENEVFDELEFQSGVDKIMSAFPIEIIIGRGKKIKINVSYGAKVYDMINDEGNIDNTMKKADKILYDEKFRKLPNYKKLSAILKRVRSNKKEIVPDDALSDKFFTAFEDATKAKAEEIKELKEREE